MTTDAFKDIENLESLPRLPFSEADTEEIATRVYDYLWQRSARASGKSQMFV